jgi:DNA-binding NarL/FixJ family response regulator
VLAGGAGLIRAGFRALLEAEQGIAVIAEAASGEEVVAAATETKPDVVLMDVGLPGLDALEATRQIMAAPELSHVKVLILGADELDEDVFGALRAGASGLLVKDTEPVELLRAVHVLAEGGALLSPSVTLRVLQEFAERLVVSPLTVKTHVSRAMIKLHARDRAKLVALAYETGFVRPRQHETETGSAQPAHRESHVGLRSRPPGNAIAPVAARPHGGSAHLRARALRAGGPSLSLAR